MKHPWLFFLLPFLVVSVAACAGSQTEMPTAANAPEVETEKPFTLDQLVPTDPGTVQLAAGQVQFVEFFAYW